jgi:hypothetical protein
MSAIESQPGNKPNLATFSAFAVSNQNHSVTFVNTSFSNRQIAEVTIPGFHPEEKEAVFYLNRGQEKSFRNSMKQVPLMNIDISFHGMDGKKIGYYKKDRSSNEGGGNITSSATNPQTMQEFFSTCDISQDKQNYVFIPTLDFYGKVLTYQMLSKVIENDFKDIPNFTDNQNGSIHFFVDFKKFFSVSKFLAQKTDSVLTNILSKNIDHSVRSYLEGVPTIYGVLWIDKALKHGMQLHFISPSSDRIYQKEMVSVGLQYVFGMKSQEKVVTFNEFLELDNDVIHCSSSNSYLKVSSRSRGRVHIDTSISGIDNGWIMIITRDRPEVISFLGSSTDVIDGTEEQLTELKYSQIETSLELFKFASKFMEIDNDSPKEVKNQVLRDHAMQIIEHIHCQIEGQAKKKVRFQEKESEISFLMKIGNTLLGIAKDVFQNQVSRLSGHVSHYQSAPSNIMRQVSAGPVDYNSSYSEEEYNRITNDFVHRN